MFFDKWYMNVANRGIKRLRLIFESGMALLTTFVVLLDTVLLLPHLFFQPSSFSPPLLFIHPLCSSTEVFPSFFTSSSFSLPPSLQYHSLSLSLSFPWWTSIVKKRCYYSCSWIKIHIPMIWWLLVNLTTGCVVRLREEPQKRKIVEKSEKNVKFGSNSAELRPQRCRQ